MASYTVQIRQVVFVKETKPAVVFYGIAEYT